MVVPANFVKQPNANMRYQVIKYEVVYKKKHMKNGTSLSACLLNVQPQLVKTITFSVSLCEINHSK